MEKIFRGQQEGESLSDYVIRELMPTQEDLDRVKGTVNKMADYLLNELSTSSFPVSAVRQGGCVEKGTAVRGPPLEVDVVLFMKDLNVRQLQQKRTRILKKVREVLTRWGQGQEEFVSLELHKFCLRCRIGTDALVVVWPALDVRQHYGSPTAVYKAMEDYRQSCTATGAKRGMRRKHLVALHYAPSFIPLQMEYVKSLPDHVKDMVRLLKKWKQGKGLSVPPYCLELLAAHHWSRHGWSDTVSFFKGVMVLLASSDMLAVALPFGDHYDVNQYTRRRSDPYVLDPVNPLYNTLTQVDLHRLNAEAAETMHLLLTPRL